MYHLILTPKKRHIYVGRYSIVQKRFKEFGKIWYWIVILFKYTLKSEVRYNLLLILLLGARRHKPHRSTLKYELLEKTRRRPRIRETTKFDSL